MSLATRIRFRLRFSCKLAEHQICQKVGSTFIDVGQECLAPLNGRTQFNSLRFTVAFCELWITRVCVVTVKRLYKYFINRIVPCVKYFYAAKGFKFLFSLPLSLSQERQNLGQKKLIPRKRKIKDTWDRFLLSSR